VSILLVGAEGNMGRRYQAILKFLGKDFVAVDKQHNRHFVKDQAARADGIIIATPTDTHLTLLAEFNEFKKPIMCEKPFTKDMRDMDLIVDMFTESRTPLNMIYQYQELGNPYSQGSTVYDYFKHGGDGLAWDCIQIVGLAKGALELSESSPLWTCSLNGWQVELSDMDAAYITHIEKWMAAPGQDLSEIREIHQKTDELHRSMKNGRVY
jgi:hypothetical protein